MNLLVRWLRGYSLRWRMVGALACVIAMLLVVGAAGVFAAWQVMRVSAIATDRSVREATALGSVRHHLAIVRGAERQMVIDYEDGAAVLKMREVWRKEIVLTKTRLAILLEGEEDEDNVATRHAITHIDAYEQKASSVLQNIQSGGYDSARVADRMLDKAREDMNEVEQHLDDIAGILDKENTARQAEFDVTMRRVAWAFGLGIGITVLLITPLTLANVRSMVAPIGEARALAAAIAEGDLSRDVPVTGSDEAASLLQALGSMQARLRDIVRQMRLAAEDILLASTEVARGNADLSGRTEQTAGSLQQTAGSTSQMRGTVQQTAESSRTASQLASSASSVAQRGGQAVAQVVSNMEAIKASSRRIADIIGVIDGIAFQTNILALNAAVEAARAGEQGRGFAVVAGEVRGLAQRSASAAREIKTLIGDSVGKVEAGASMAAAAGGTMDELVDGVRRVSDLIVEISAASAEQSEGIGSIDQAITQLDQATQQNAALVEESAAAAESLSEQSRRLAGLVAGFRLPPQDGVAAGA